MCRSKKLSLAGPFNYALYGRHINICCLECFTDAARQDKSDLALTYFLVMRHVIKNFGNAWCTAFYLMNSRRKADQIEMIADKCNIAGRCKA